MEDFVVFFFNYLRLLLRLQLIFNEINILIFTIRQLLKLIYKFYITQPIFLHSLIFEGRPLLGLIYKSYIAQFRFLSSLIFDERLLHSYFKKERIAFKDIQNSEN